MIDSSGLMMIEPKGSRASEPVYDRTSLLAAFAFGEADYDKTISYRGFHVCSCGEASDNREWAVRGLLTNSLLVHYVVWHREDVPADELEKLEAFGGG